MVFNSYSFLFAFLPITLFIYYACHRLFEKDYSNVILICASLVFIAHAGFYNLLMVLLSVCVNYVMNLFLGRGKEARLKKIIATITVVFNVAFLCSFKFVFPHVGKDILMSLGISFYTFQQISYTVENYKYNFHEKYGIKKYLLSVLFFAKFLQGPITYHDELIPQFKNEEKRKLSYENIAMGLYALGIGLTKKVLVADNFAKIVDYGYGHITSLNSFEAMLTVFSYGLQLYFDFSGYCDMAIGIGKMFNIDLPENFNSPYKAKNITDFWKRWHITLTRFLTKYVYIPLGGNRKGELHTYINIMIVFLVSGLWHGTGVGFIVWGLMHGIASVLYRIFKEKYDKIPGLIQWGLTFIYVNIAWVVFRAPSLEAAIRLLKQIFVGRKRFGMNAELTETLLQPTIISALSRLLPFVWVISLFMLISICVCAIGKNSNEYIRKFRPNWFNLILMYVLLCLSTFSISGVSTFLYVNF